MLQELTVERPRVRESESSIRHARLSAHYDALLQRIQAASLDANASQAIGIIACGPRAGASTVAFNTAMTAAHAGCGSVLYLDADIDKRPGRNSVGVVPSPGLADALAGDAEPLDCARLTAYENLSILSGRGVNARRDSKVDPSTFRAVVDELKRHFKLLVIDIPTPTEFNGSVLLAAELDGVVLVIEAERADGRAALRTKQLLTSADANVLGVVLNKRRQHVPGWLYRLL
jgi:MinD-like ATPase involved in chromosome partitioning or flagellar assembly